MEERDFKRALSFAQHKCTLPGHDMMDKVVIVTDAEEIGIRYCSAQTESLKNCISTLEHHKELLTSAIEKILYEYWACEVPTKESEILKDVLVKVYSDKR